MSGVQSVLESIKSADIKHALRAYQAGTLGFSDGCLNDTEARVVGSCLAVDRGQLDNCSAMNHVATINSR